MQSITTYHRHRHPAGPHIALAAVVVVAVAAAVEKDGIDCIHLLYMMIHYLPVTFCCPLRSVSIQSPCRNHMLEYHSSPVANYMIVVVVVVAPETVDVLAAIKLSAETLPCQRLD